MDTVPWLTAEQDTALRSICDRYNVTYRPADFRPAIPKGWVEGWVGGRSVAGIYIGCSPEGRIHS
jgi:hypothetical protein